MKGEPTLVVGNESGRRETLQIIEEVSRTVVELQSSGGRR